MLLHLLANLQILIVVGAKLIRGRPGLFSRCLSFLLVHIVVNARLQVLLFQQLVCCLVQQYSICKSLVVAFILVLLVDSLLSLMVVVGSPLAGAFLLCLQKNLRVRLVRGPHRRRHRHWHVLDLRHPGVLLGRVYWPMWAVSDLVWVVLDHPLLSMFLSST